MSGGGGRLFQPLAGAYILELITQRSLVQIHPPQPNLSTTCQDLAAPTNSQKLPISKNLAQALATIRLSTISTTLLFASLFDDDIA